MENSLQGSSGNTALPSEVSNNLRACYVFLSWAHLFRLPECTMAAFSKLTIGISEGQSSLLKVVGIMLKNNMNFQGHGQSIFHEEPVELILKNF